MIHRFLYNIYIYLLLYVSHRLLELFADHSGVSSVSRRFLCALRQMRWLASLAEASDGKSRAARSEGAEATSS